MNFLKSLVDRLGAGSNLPESGEAQLDDVIQRLIAQMGPVKVERRKEGRSTMFCPCTLTLDEENGLFMPVYVRDLSTDGIGFLHGTPIDAEEVTASFMTEGGESVQLRVRLIWSRPFDRHWHISGGTFISLVNSD
jgi:hypothetical protein